MRCIVAVIVMIMLMSSAVFAMGPVMVGPSTAAWDRSVDASITGYYLYYRSQGSTTWSNTNRSAVIPQTAVGTTPTYNVLTILTTNGSYELAVTARNAAGDESGPSNIVPFGLAIPAAPANARVQ